MKKLFLILLLIPTLLSAQDFSHRYFHYNQYFDAPAPFSITANTIDGADNNAFCISGGGACLTNTRGASILGGGNENAGGYAGTLTLESGDVASSRGIIFNPGGYIGWNMPRMGASTTSDLVFGYTSTASSVATIRGVRGVDADDGTLALTAGSSCDPTEGACITMKGNEVGSAEGQIYITAGTTARGSIYLQTTANGNITFQNRGLSRWLISDNSGNLTQDATTGGNIVMAKTTTSIIHGLAAMPADVTTSVGTAENYTFHTSPGSHYNTVFAGGANSAASPVIAFLKSRASDGTADTIVANADALGKIYFTGADGVDFKDAAILEVNVDGVPGAGDMPGRFVFKVSPDGSATPAEALRISNDKAVLAAGTIRTTATDIGWRVATGADTACTTTCGANKGCVFGQNTAALGYNIVSCSDNTADVCVCTTT